VAPARARRSVTHSIILPIETKKLPVKPGW
jgi:hypothetical protein